MAIRVGRWPSSHRGNVLYTILQLERQAMKPFHPSLGGLMLAGLVGAAAACSNDLVNPSSSSSTPAEVAMIGAENLSAVTATLRVRCERRPGRSKISVDANDVAPRNGLFRARVRAAGGTVTSALKRAVGDEVEFDFDSNTEAGATRIPANFIQRRTGPDVVGILLNAQGDVVARRGVECEFRS
jgi:hypothetical protein